MFSNSAKYAIKAVLYLALHATRESKVHAKELSAEIDVPNAYMAKLLQQLVRHEVVSSTRGPRGGFYLTEANRNTPLIKVIHLFDGEDPFKSCVLGLKQCDESKPCPLHEKISPYRWTLLTALEFNTIQDFTDELGKQLSYLPK